jgi:membrane protease YdiL (CAAX protease family)
MNNSPTDPKEHYLQFCPGCGNEIKWTKDIRFCMTCGMNLIPFIPKEKIQEWLGIPLTPEEIEELYNYRPAQVIYPLVQSYNYRQRRPWKILAAFWVPLLAILVKLIVSVVILVIYLSIAVGLNNIDTTNMDALLNEHLLPLTIIEFVTQIAFLLVPYWLTAVYFPYKAPKKERWESLGVPFGLKGKQWATEIGIGAAFSLIMTGLVFGVQYASAYLTQLFFGIPADALLSVEADPSIYNFSSNFGFIILYCAFMILSIAPSEEVLFRGFTQKGIQDSFRNPKLGKALGLVLTAVYFSFFHIYSFLLIDEVALRIPLLFFTFLPYLSLSLVLGFLYMWRKNLISAITAHALYNILQFLIFVVIIH